MRIYKKRFDLETFKDNLLANSHLETLVSSELIVCSRAPRYLLANKMLLSSANNRNCRVNSLLVAQNFTTARKSSNILLTYWKAFFVRHSSEHKTWDSDRKVDRNIYLDAVKRDRIRLIDPKSGQVGTIRHRLLE